MTELRSVNVNSFGSIIDSSGAGDWLTAGFVDKLIGKYRTPAREIDEQVVIDALSFGHSLAEDACTHIGALGKLFFTDNMKLHDIQFVCDFCKSTD